MADDPDRPTETPPPIADVHERATLATCLACDGHFLTERRDDPPPAAAPGQKPSGTFSFVQCRWCSNGLMTVEQAKRWAEHAIRTKSETPPG